MRCPRCHSESPPDAAFCPECGARLEIACPACGTANAPSYKFCKRCGQTLAPIAPPAAKFVSPETYTPKHLAEKILTSRSALEGERKQVTVLFCDLANSTALAERLGPEAMHTFLNRFFELALAEVHRYEGTINQFLGDGFMALFGAPLAHEDNARRAVLAALGIQRAVKGQRAALGEDLVLRMGLNTGLVVVGKIGDNLRMDYTAIGDTTNFAARLQHLAEPGAIYLSETTHGLVEAYIDSTFLGKREVKGLPPQPVWRVDNLKPRAARFDAALRRGLSPLVGRSRELDILEGNYREARSGSLRVVNIRGEAGIGKSRLLYEFRQRLQGEPAFSLQGHCSPYGTATSFLPFIELVRTAFGLAEGESQAEVERGLRRGLEVLGLEPEDALPLLLNLLGLDPGEQAFRGLDGEIIGARTRELLQTLLRERCRLSPTVLVIDDLHWVDAASEEVLRQTIQSREALPLLILCAFRTQYRPPWAGLPEVAELSLAPLSDESCLQLVQRRLGTEKLPEELTRLIVEKAEGNPLFAEELTRYVLESEHVTVAERGVTVHAGRDAEVSVPGSLRDLVMARVDRLAEGPRTVLQAASVIGRQFPLELVRSVSDVNGQLPQHLHHLEAQELILRHEAPGREEYQFKHALIQDIIYESLLTPRRVTLHERVAEAIEQSYPDRLGEWVEVLAHHWSRTPRVDKAARYLALAGEKSLRVYAVEEAHNRLRQVLEWIETVPGCADEAFLADVLLSSALVYYYRKDFKSLIDLLERYRPRVEALGDQRRLSLFLFWLGFALLSSDRLDTARALLEGSLALGEVLGDEECVGYASMGLVWFYDWAQRGQSRDIVDRLANRGFEIAKRRGDIYLASKCLAGLANYKRRCGRPLEARDLASRVLELGRSARDPRTIALGLNLWASQNFAEERYEEALQNAEEAFRLSPDPLDRLIARGLKGGILAMMGRPQEGLEIHAQVRKESLADFGWAARQFELYYAMLMVLAGKMAAGVHWIEDCIRRFAKSDNEADQALGHLVLGEIYLQMVLREKKLPLGVILRNLGFLLRTFPIAARKAEYHLQEAVRRAWEVGMPLHLARSLLGLGRLCQAKKCVEEARRYLEEARQIADPLAIPALSERIRQALEAVT